MRLEPARNRVDRAHEPEHRHLGIALANRPVCDPFRHEAAKLPIELAATRLDHSPMLRREIAQIGEDGIGRKIVGQQRDVARERALQLVEPAAALLAVLERLIAEILRMLVAVIEQILLALDVVVECRLGDIQRRGDIVERGVMKALLAEGPPCRLHQRQALGLDDFLRTKRVLGPPPLRWLRWRFRSRGLAGARHDDFDLPGR